MPAEPSSRPSCQTLGAMKLKPQFETLSNIEVAHRQLERAIALFMDEQDFVSALTLAGAAEEILGKLLAEQGKSHWLESISVAALVVLGFPKAEHESPEAREAKREIANIANFHKNRLKHINVEGTMTFSVIDQELSILNFLSEPSYGDDGSNRHEIVVA